MSVYLTIPSARPPAEANPVLQRWRDAGYKIALWRDADDQGLVADIVFHQPVYPGYAEAVNQLVRLVMDADHDADWFVAAGDDVLPDPNNRAYEIAVELASHFAGLGYVHRRLLPVWLGSRSHGTSGQLLQRRQHHLGLQSA